MKEFSYKITDSHGIHARPAGRLVKETGKFDCNIFIEFADKKADAKKIFSVMSLGIKNNDMVKITFDGPDEDTAMKDIMEFFEKNL